MADVSKNITFHLGGNVKSSILEIQGLLQKIELRLNSSLAKYPNLLKGQLAKVNKELREKRKLTEDSVKNQKKEIDLVAKNLKLWEKIDKIQEAQRKKKQKELAKSGKKLYRKGVSLVGDVTGINIDPQSILGDILSTMKTQLSAASYGLGTSIFSNASARNTQLQYGISGGQAYALNQTMSALGMQSQEDLLYMNSNQRALFTTLMEKYSTWYDEMEASGYLQNIQAMQLEFSMMKQEIAMKFLNWVGNNKEAILTILNGLLKGIELIANGVIGIVNAFSQQKMSYLEFGQLSDVINNSSSLVNRNVSISPSYMLTTNSSSSASEIMDTFSQATQTTTQDLISKIPGISWK